MNGLDDLPTKKVQIITI